MSTPQPALSPEFAVGIRESIRQGLGRELEITKKVIDHRGQLAVYLRPMGSKVPSIYGGSADEPWQG
jgi:hypothetical protein